MAIGEQIKKITSTPRAVLGFIAIVGYIFVTAGFFGILFFGSKLSLPAGHLGVQVVGMLGMLVGTWTTIVGVVYNFHYGSSDGSKVKDEILSGGGADELATDRGEGGFVHKPDHSDQSGEV